MKKLFILLLALVATTALWAEDFSAGGIYYNILTDKINEVAVTFRGSDFYSYNEYMGSVTIPETVIYNGTTYSVTSIGDWAFCFCTGLTSITIPNSVTSIGDCAFADCSSLTSIIVEDANSTYDSRENCNAIIETATNTLIVGCQNTIIPNSVTSIGEGAFYKCSSLTSVTIPNSVTSIGYGAFVECSSLTSVTIGNSVTTIGGWAFAQCSSLTSVTIPNSVTSIGEYAFEDCSGLTSVTIGNSVTSIGERAFWDCDGLTSVVWNAKNYADFPDFSAPFHSQITSFTFGDSVQHIPAYLCHGMNNLTSITIPNSVTSIGDYAFFYCSGLTSVTIGNSVTSIGGHAFYDCSGLTSVTSLAEIPPTLGSLAFYNVSTTIPVYVACSSVSAYQSAKGWKDFTNIQCMPEDESAVDNVHSQSTDTQKLIRDGQLLILRDGKTYNAQGAALQDGTECLWDALMGDWLQA